MLRRTTNNDNSARGAAVEAAAERWLCAQGLVFVARNFRCKLGEIDLIMRDDEQLVFVEVRFRQNQLYGSAVESVTRSKQQRVVRAAQLYIDAHPQWRNRTCRFDVLGARRIAAENIFQWQWLRDAFGSD
jgi:putative endonuclease